MHRNLVVLFTVIETILVSVSSTTIPPSSSSTSSKKSKLSFLSGGIALDPPQQYIPPILEAYHTISLRLTEEVYRNPNITVIRGIPYGNLVHQKLDIWTASAASNVTSSTSRGGGGTEEEEEDDKRNLLPVVIAIHGGGWEVGYREYVGFMASHLCTGISSSSNNSSNPNNSSNANNSNSTEPPPLPNSQKVILVAPSYKLGYFQHQAWPQSRDDILESLRWVTQNIHRYGGDPNRITLTGHSAGGHLAACIGLHPSLLSSHGIDPSCLDAVFLVSCPLGLRKKDWFVPKRFLLDRMLYWWDISYRNQTIRMLRPVVGPVGDDVGKRRPLLLWNDEGWVGKVTSASVRSVVQSWRIIIDSCRYRDCRLETWSVVHKWMTQRTPWIELYTRQKHNVQEAIRNCRDVLIPPSTLRTVTEASPLATLERMSEQELDQLPYIHYAYAARGDFEICRVHGRLIRRLVPEHRLEVMVLSSVSGHLETHFCTNERDCEWYGALGRVLDAPWAAAPSPWKEGEEDEEEGEGEVGEEEEEEDKREGGRWSANEWGFGLKGDKDGDGTNNWCALRDFMGEKLKDIVQLGRIYRQ